MEGFAPSPPPPPPPLETFLYNFVEPQDIKMKFSSLILHLCGDFAPGDNSHCLHVLPWQPFCYECLAEK